jgi:hypothetical protein
MNFSEAQKHLETRVKALLPEVCVQDNLVDKSKSFPCVVIEPDGSRLLKHGGGSSLSGEHDFSLWVLYAYNGSFTDSREAMLEIVAQLLEIERFYCDERIEYGNDLVHGTRCVLAHISGRVA